MTRNERRLAELERLVADQAAELRDLSAELAAQSIVTGVLMGIRNPAGAASRRPRHLHVVGGAR